MWGYGLIICLLDLLNILIRFLLILPCKITILHPLSILVNLILIAQTLLEFFEPLKKFLHPLNSISQIFVLNSQLIRHFQDPIHIFDLVQMLLSIDPFLVNFPCFCPKCLLSLSPQAFLKFSHFHRQLGSDRFDEIEGAKFCVAIDHISQLFNQILLQILHILLFRFDIGTATLFVNAAKKRL